MFDFIRKEFLWKAWDEGLDKQIPPLKDWHFKSVQDLAVYDQIKHLQGAQIAEVGGGHSRLLEVLSKHNKCTNIEKFEGQGGGPKKAKSVDNTELVQVFLGEFSEQLKPDTFDAVVSISVIEHVPLENLQAFVDDGVRILKPGGLWVHAIDMYIDDAPTDFFLKRFAAYRKWLDHKGLEPVGPVYDGPLEFKCDMATNPDNVMYKWGQVAPSLIEFRQRAQSVSIILVARKR